MRAISPTLFPDFCLVLLKLLSKPALQTGFFVSPLTNYTLETLMPSSTEPSPKKQPSENEESATTQKTTNSLKETILGQPSSCRPPLIPPASKIKYAPHYFSKYRQKKEFIDKRSLWQKNLGNIIFKLDTPAARNYDKALIILISASIIAVALETVNQFSPSFRQFLRDTEWFFTFIFTFDYIARVITARKPLKYIFSFYGFIDLATILPSYLSLFFPGSQYLLAGRALRLVRVFQVFKLMKYSYQSNILLQALIASREKIVVFFITVLSLVTVFGTLIYLIEGPKHGFTSIPTSIYWAIVTVTTVGYGDIAPKTHIGKLLASFAMLMGYAIIAVPTGIVTAGFKEVRRAHKKENECLRCGLSHHEIDARYCKRCGERLTERPPDSEH